VHLTVGMPVVVDMAGFQRYGLSVGEEASVVCGTVVAMGPDGITVRLEARLLGLDTVTVAPELVTAAR
jgi:hypothetical protein